MYRSSATISPYSFVSVNSFFFLVSKKDMMETSTSAESRLIGPAVAFTSDTRASEKKGGPEKSRVIRSDFLL